MTEKEKSSFQIKDSEDLFKIICACVAGVFVFFIKELLDFREYLRENNIWTLPWSCTLISLATIVVLYVSIFSKLNSIEVRISFIFSFGIEL